MARANRQVRAMREAWGELLSRGQSVKGVRISPVGDVFLLTETPEGFVPSANDAADWVDLAGEKTLPRA